MDIRIWFTWLVLLYSTILFGAIEQDSIEIDTRWNYWNVNEISANGEWVSIYQISPNDETKSKSFAVHTVTNEKLEVTELNYLGFTASNFLLGKKRNETVELDLKTKKQSVLGTFKQQDWVEESQTLYYITEENELVLRRYEKKRAIDLMTIPKVSKYYLSPSKTHLLYQKEGDNRVSILDIKTGKERSLIQINEELNNVTWSLDGTVVVFPLKDGRLQTIDLNEGVYKSLEVPNESEGDMLLNISFFPNNDIFFERFIETKEDNPEKDYLDIWNGNDRELKYKEQPKKEGKWSTFVYHQSTNTLSELPTSKKRRYLNIGINNYLLVFEPLELQDYSTYMEKVRYRILDLKAMQELGDLTVASSLGNLLNKSPNNQYITYPKGEDWEMYDFKTQRRLKVQHRGQYSKPIWSDDSMWVYYSDGQNLLKINVKSGETDKLTDLKGENQFLFGNETKRENSRYIDISKPFLFSVRHINNNMSYCSLFQDKITAIVANTVNRLNLQYLKQGISNDGKTMVWTEENFNLPPTVNVYRKGKVKTLLEPELPKELYAWRKQKVIHYKDKYGVDLTGVLWYPKGFAPTRKYPMITYIYDRQGRSRSVFGYSTPLVGSGYNRTLLNEQGYFVFMPDTYVSDEGSGLSALECVTKGIEAITLAESAIDETKIGLIGHSFGGYKTSFILSQTDLFAAGVSGAGAHDLISFSYEYNYALNKPNYFRVEGPQQDFRVSFGESPTKYYMNSPIHFAQNYKSPVLLWAGLQDYNSHWEQTRHMYIALQRYKKPVIALFYKKEGHNLRKKKGQLDLTHRILDWFDYYLKKKIDTEWINKGINYFNY